MIYFFHYSKLSGIIIQENLEWVGYGLIHFLYLPGDWETQLII